MDQTRASKDSDRLCTAHACFSTYGSMREEDNVALLLSPQPVMTSGSKLWISPDVEI